MQADGGGDFTMELDLILLFKWAFWRNGRKQSPRVWMQRMIVYLLGTTEFNHFAKVHDCYPCTDVFDNTEIMGYEKIS